MAKRKPLKLPCSFGSVTIGDLKASIAFRRRGLTVTIGALNDPPVYSRIEEFGGEIIAKRFSFFIHNTRETVGPMLNIPLRKENVGAPGLWIRSKRLASRRSRTSEP